jgi:iron complex transport system substrate-binding protein
MREINEITGEIVDAAYHIHTRLGPGLLESVYEAILAQALEKRGFHVERQKRVPLEFDGLIFPEAFRADLIVQDLILIELKSVERIPPVYRKQVLTYLRLLNLPVGLLLNFGGETMKDGIIRVSNSLS